MFHNLRSLFQPLNQDSKVLDLLIYRILFTFLPFTVTILSKKYFSTSDFNEFQLFLIYLTSFGGFFSIGFLATFQYLSARDLLSFRIFQYLLIYLCILFFIYSIVLHYNFLSLSNWCIGIIVILYLGNESLLNEYIGQRAYKIYYFYSVLRYTFFLSIVLTGVFYGKYNILVLYELIVFLSLCIKFYLKYKDIAGSEQVHSIFFSNVLPNISSSIGAKNILLYTTFFLTSTETANIKFTYTFLGIVNFIPQVYLSDYTNKLIKNQLLSFTKSKVVFFSFFFFLASLLFSFSLFYFSTFFNFFGNLDLILILLLSVVNLLTQLSIYFNQILFALGKQRLRLFSDLVFSVLMFSLLGFISNVNSVIFLIIASICVLFTFGLSYYRFRNDMS